MQEQLTSKWCRLCAIHGVDLHLITGILSDATIEGNFPDWCTSVSPVIESSLQARQCGVPTGIQTTPGPRSNGHFGRCFLHIHGVWLATEHAVAVASAELVLTRVVTAQQAFHCVARRTVIGEADAAEVLSTKGSAIRH